MRLVLALASWTFPGRVLARLPVTGQRLVPLGGERGLA
jgi:hypothetical protein